MKWFKLAIEDRKIILQQASAQSGINEKALEKDLWVTIVLDAVFKTPYAHHLHFKGGTSLSKAWQIIERFSEDIDLSIDRSFYGFGEDLSYSQIKKLKRISSEFVSSNFRKELEKTLVEMGVPAQLFSCKATPIPKTRRDTADPQEIIIEYVSILDSVEYLPDTIKVEVSARSINESTQMRQLTSLIGGLLAQLELSEPFQVRCIEPQITLLEKVFLLHEEFTKDTIEMRHVRMSRHLYDLFLLCESNYANIALDDTPLYNRIIAHRQHYIRQTGINYENHGMQSISFLPPNTILERYEEDYEKMKLNMIYGKAPAFNDLIEKLRALQDKIRITKNSH
jgi:predicted nucleotidyltransferase component of viral defense system